MKLRLAIVIPCCIILMLLAVVGWRFSVLRMRTKLVIAPDTTFVTEPERPDGTIDFEAAIHRRYSAGLTLDENAVVLLDHVFLPEFSSLELKFRYYQYLGATEPLRGECILKEEEFANRKWGNPSLNREERTRFMEETGLLQSKAWSRTEYPQVAEWIDANETPLKLIEQASRRPRFYYPLVTDQMLVNSVIPLVQNLRTATRLLVARATLRISEGNIDAAIQDLLTCHRLARLVGQHPTLIAGLVSFALESMSVLGDQTLLSSPGLTAEQTRSFLRELEALPDPTDIVKTINEGERLMVLDSFQWGWLGAEHAMIPDIVPAPLSGLDINTILRRANTHFDQQATALREANLKDRQTALKTLAADLEARAAKIATGPQIISSLTWDGRKTVSEKVAELYIRMTAPGLAGIQTAKDRATIRFELLKISVALTVYRIETGEYPANLQTLVPQYLKAIPLDSFIEKPLQYRRLADGQPKEDGFLLYSVGDDGNDDGGIPPKGGLTGDIVIRVTRH